MHTTLIDLLRYRADHQPDQKEFRFLVNGEKEEANLTYQELDCQARRIGAYLQQQHAYGERVLLLYPPGLDFIMAFFGCLYAGAIAVPAYPPRRNRQLSRIPAIVEDAQAAFALTTETFRPKITSWFQPESGKSEFYVIATDSLDEAFENHWREPNVSGESLAFLQYTSGSTAAPRGVMVSHANLLHNSAIIHTAFEHSPKSLVVSWLPLYHDMGLIGGILQPLFGGFPVILMSPAAFIQHPIRWLRAISSYQATTSGGPNFGYELCIEKTTPDQRETLDLHSWDLAFNGAEPVHHETIERFTRLFAPCGFRKQAFYPCYGLAEATLFMTGSQKEKPPIIRTFKESALEKNLLVETSRDDRNSWTFVGCGHPSADQIVSIVCPDSLQPRPEGYVGEIWFAGSSMTQGYWNRTKETDETFRACLEPAKVKRTGGSTPSQGYSTPFLRTGDLGFIKDGELFITGRLKDLIIIRGRNHYPEDIEWRIEHCHPLIRRECTAVFTVNITGEERLIVAAEVDHQQWDRRRKSRRRRYRGEERRKPADLQPPIPRMQYVQEAITNVRQAVSEHHELQVYAVLLLKTGTIPKTSSGKTQRHACKARYLDSALEVLASSVLGTMEATIAKRELDREALLHTPPAEQRQRLESYLQQLVASVLHVEPSQIHIDQRLSRVGLDSLMAVELHHRIESELGFNWPVTTFLSSTTVAELAEESLNQLHNAPKTPKPDILATHFRGIFPLSHNQQALWFLYRLNPKSAAYNVPFVLRIRSRVDHLALQRAFQQLINRHDALRTTYSASHDELCQHVHEHLFAPFETLDIASWNQGMIQAKVTELASCSFDLEKGPILRISLLTRAADDHVLALTFHHIAVDFWSLLVLMDELHALYPAELTGTLPQLTLHTLSYADFIRWQQEMLDSPEGGRLLAYWREQLSGELPALNLPTDRPRPPVQTYRGASYAFRLGRELSGRLQTIAQLCDATLYMTLLAAFQVLLFRYSGQEDILVGSPTAGRTRAGFDETVGYFINPVVMRADLSSNPTFPLFLNQVRRTVLDALEHQEYPFPLLVEHLKLRRDASRSPGFQVMFVMQEPHRLKAAAPFALREAGARMNLGGLQVESLKVDHRIAQFDLTLMVVNTDEGLIGSIEYNTDLFNPDTIQRMAGYFRTLLEGIVAHPDQPVAELPLLTKAERHQILVEWNDTAVEYPQNKCIHQLFEEQVERTPEAIAVVFAEHPCEGQGNSGSGYSLTYRELNAKANQLAHYLRKLGVGPEVLVGICMERSIEMIVGLLGILKAGGAYVPLDPEYPKERLAFMLQDSQVSVLLTQYAMLAYLPQNQTRRVCIDTERNTIAQESEDNPENMVKPEHLAYVIYTSGSTGKPKGVLIEHQAIARHSLCIQEHYALTPLDRVLQFASLSFDTSLEQIFPSLLAGATLIMRGQNVWTPAEMQQYMRKHGITVINLPPAYWQQLSREGLKSLHMFPCSSLRLVIVGGDIMTSEALDVWQQLPTEGIRLLNAYGPTETIITTLTYEVGSHLRRRIPIGRPLPNRSVYIVDFFGKPVPVGVAGELCIGGKGLARGYLNRPELTQEKFIPDPFSNQPDARLYKTGDLVHYLPDGNIEFLGRIDHQVKIRGFRIELGEIENVLAEYPTIREVVVIAREDQPGEKRLVAYVVGAKGERQKVKAERLRKYLKQRLPDYMIPSAFVVLDALPLTHNGKVDRRALPAPDRTDQKGGDETPRTQIEETLASIWAETLNVERVGIHDNFFELGGDSILSLRIISRARQAGLQITPKEILLHQTIAELSAVAESGGECLQSVARINVPENEAFPLTPIQHWFFEQQFADAHHWNQAVLLEFRCLPDIERFKQALQQLVKHHDALRLRFIQNGAGWQQKYAGSQENLSVVRIDMADIPEAERTSVCRTGASKLQASINLAEPPLLKAALFDFGPDTSGYALLIIHHLAVDGVSWRILLEDLHTILARHETSASSQTDELPPKTTSYKEWAEYLLSYAQSKALSAEAEYWITTLRRVKESSQGSFNTVASSEQVTVSLDAEQTQALLHDVPPVYHTHIDEILLTALTQTLSQWTGQKHVLLDLESHGRETHSTQFDLSRTVGWFTSIFPVVLTVESPHPGEALKSVKEQLRKIPQQGIGYDVLRYLHPDTQLRQQLQSLPQADVLFNYLGQMEYNFPAFKPILPYENGAAGPMRSPRGHRTHLLELNSLITEQTFQMVWTYSRTIHDRKTIERLAQEFISVLQRLIDHCLSPEAGGYTPSDFPVARLNQQQLEKIMNNLKRQ